MSIDQYLDTLDQLGASLADTAAAVALDYGVSAEELRALDRLEERYRGYAVKFCLDCTGSPTDDALSRVLVGCARCPRRDEFPAIRRHVAAYRAGEMIL
jgi:hypothetical protein